jgi:Carboxylesterase family
MNLLRVLFDFIDANTLPLLTLPYATYQAQSYDNSHDYYIFANIRFAAPPVGDLRWAPPAAPLQESGVQNGSLAHECYQSYPDQVSFPPTYLTRSSQYSNL